ncbi:hypothetical protein M569_14037 [Genlisea aurea]|uniref:Uncharacterized protein n=1 Tax=Genlisea aurea TaxID=192259 RepID=S8C1W3_9LAMI|nr:hypothetical protein M569_14037 [Genlisea aurea]
MKLCLTWRRRRRPHLRKKWPPKFWDDSRTRENNNNRSNREKKKKSLHRRRSGRRRRGSKSGSDLVAEENEFWNPRRGPDETSNKELSERKGEAATREAENGKSGLHSVINASGSIDVQSIEEFFNAWQLQVEPFTNPSRPKPDERRAGSSGTCDKDHSKLCVGCSLKEILDMLREAHISPKPWKKNDENINRRTQTIPLFIKPSRHSFRPAKLISQAWTPKS